MWGSGTGTARFHAAKVKMDALHWVTSCVCGGVTGVGECGVGDPGAGTVRFHAAKVKMDALHWDY